MGLFDFFKSKKKYEEKYVEYPVQDMKTDYEMYIDAAEQGDPTALYKIGLCYYDGDGIGKNLQKAVYYLSAAANKGNIDAYYWLGKIYEEGNGVAKDLKRSFEYYKRGAEKGDYASEAMVGKDYLYGTGTEKNYGLAYKWLSKSPQDMFFSGYYLGQYYVLTGNKQKAIELLEQVVLNNWANSPMASNLLNELYAENPKLKLNSRAPEVEAKVKRSNDLLDRLIETMEEEGFE